MVRTFSGILCLFYVIWSNNLIAGGRLPTQVRQKPGALDDVTPEVMSPPTLSPSANVEISSSDDQISSKTKVVDKLVTEETVKVKASKTKEKTASLKSSATSKGSAKKSVAETKAKSQNIKSSDSTSTLNAGVSEGTAIKKGAISESSVSIKTSENAMKESSSSVEVKSSNLIKDSSISSSKSLDHSDLDVEIIGGNRGLSIGREAKHSSIEGTDATGASSIGVKGTNVKARGDLVGGSSSEASHSVKSEGDSSVVKTASESSSSTVEKSVVESSASTSVDEKVHGSVGIKSVTGEHTEGAVGIKVGQNIGLKGDLKHEDRESGKESDSITSIGIKTSIVTSEAEKLEDLTAGHHHSNTDLSSSSESIKSSEIGKVVKTSAEGHHEESVKDSTVVVAASSDASHGAVKDVVEVKEAHIKESSDSIKIKAVKTVFVDTSDEDETSEDLKLMEGHSSGETVATRPGRPSKPGKIQGVKVDGGSLGTKTGVRGSEFRGTNVGIGAGSTGFGSNSELRGVNVGADPGAEPCCQRVLIEEETWTEGNTIVTRRKYKSKGPLGQTIYSTETMRRTSKPMTVYYGGTGGVYRSSSGSISSSSKYGSDTDRGDHAIPSQNPYGVEDHEGGLNIALDKLRAVPGHDSEEWESAESENYDRPVDSYGTKVSGNRKTVVRKKVSTFSSGGASEVSGQDYHVSSIGQSGTRRSQNMRGDREEYTGEESGSNAESSSSTSSKTTKKKERQQTSQTRSRASRSISYRGFLSKRRAFRHEEEGDGNLVVNIYFEGNKPGSSHKPRGSSHGHNTRPASNLADIRSGSAPDSAAEGSFTYVSATNTRTDGANNQGSNNGGGANSSPAHKIITRTRSLPRKCGQIMIGITGEVDSPKIVRGNEARAGTWPWLITFQHEGYHSCGGTLISERHIITATHCFPNFVPAENFTVHAGKHIKEGVVLPIEQKRRIKRLVKHPGFNRAGKFDNDLAMVEVNEPFVFGEYVQPACLPANNERIDSRAKCCVAGFGETRGTGNDDVMNELCVPILSRTLCNSSEYYNGRLTGTMMCAGFEQGQKDSCKGDSGGPFICNLNGVHKLFGVTSWGEDCAKPKRPGLYTDLSLFLEWIRDNL